MPTETACDSVEFRTVIEALASEEKIVIFTLVKSPCGDFICVGDCGPSGDVVISVIVVEDFASFLSGDVVVDG